MTLKNPNKITCQIGYPSENKTSYTNRFLLRSVSDRFSDRFFRLQKTALERRFFRSVIALKIKKITPVFEARKTGSDRSYKIGTAPSFSMCRNTWKRRAGVPVFEITMQLTKFNYFLGTIGTILVSIILALSISTRRAEHITLAQTGLLQVTDSRWMPGYPGLTWRHKAVQKGENQTSSSGGSENLGGLL